MRPHHRQPYPSTQGQGVKVGRICLCAENWSVNAHINDLAYVERSSADANQHELAATIARFMMSQSGVKIYYSERLHREGAGTDGGAG